jgi:hypothetical protein
MLSGFHHHLAPRSRRRVGAQKLLDRAGNERGVLDQPVAVLGMLGHVPDRGCNRAQAGVDASHHQHPKGGLDVGVGQGLAVAVLRVDQ